MDCVYDRIEISRTGVTLSVNYECSKLINGTSANGENSGRGISGK